jgi:hypothetical protein
LLLHTSLAPQNLLRRLANYYRSTANAPLLSATPPRSSHPPLLRQSTSPSRRLPPPQGDAQTGAVRWRGGRQQEQMRSAVAAVDRRRASDKILQSVPSALSHRCPAADAAPLHDSNAQSTLTGDLTYRPSLSDCAVVTRPTSLFHGLSALHWHPIYLSLRLHHHMPHPDYWVDAICRRFVRLYSQTPLSPPLRLAPPHSRLRMGKNVETTGRGGRWRWSEPGAVRVSAVAVQSRSFLPSFFFSSCSPLRKLSPAPSSPV